jgi:hypothetical protein
VYPVVDLAALPLRPLTVPFSCPSRCPFSLQLLVFLVAIAGFPRCNCWFSSLPSIIGLTRLIRYANPTDPLRRW